MKSLYIFFIITLLASNSYAQSYLTYEELKSQKAEAVSLEQYRLAKIIQEEIDKRDQAGGTVSITIQSEKSQEVLELEKQQREAVKNKNWALAKTIQTQKNKALGIGVAIEPIISRWKDGIYPNDYIFKEDVDGSLSYKIDGTEIWNYFEKNNDNSYTCNKSSGPYEKNNIGSIIKRIDENTMELLYKGDGKTYTLTRKGSSISSSPSSSNSQINFGSNRPSTNKREIIYQKMLKSDFSTFNKSTSVNTTQSETETVTESTASTKLKNTEENTNAKDLKYRRSSLYTLMVNDPLREHANVIYDAFGNSDIPVKFNDHNIGPYLIEGQGGVKNEDIQSQNISNYLTTNNVANAVIAKWFNRDAEGKFNMNLIAERGMYDASAIDVHVAKQTERGTAMLADAGEELISKTFVIVNDYKYTNKEEVVAKAKKASGWAKMAAGYVPGGSTITKSLDVAETAATVAGKGYVVKTTSYLYQLVWDEEAAATFYNNYWTDKNNFDPSKVEAFNNTSNFKLKLVGYQSAWADVQSSIFSNKNNEDLIKMATVKATDKAIAKLAVNYEEFRTKTPLFSVEPLSAKIGSKEGLEKGDKFEVLEQVITEEGKTVYNRKGIIKVDQVWDNSLTPEEMEELKRQGKLAENQYTTFQGGGNYYPGMLIKQIK